MDPLSDIISLLRASSIGCRGLDAGGAWALDFAAYGSVKFYALHRGACWLQIAGEAERRRLRAGDVILMATGCAFQLYSDAGAAALDAYAVFASVPPGHTVRLNDGGTCKGVGGYFNFEGPGIDLLVRGLPPVLHLCAHDEAASLLPSIERLFQELREPRPGGVLIAEHFAQALLVEALRAHLADDDTSRKSNGWLAALADSRLSAALGAMHADPAYPWTLQALARRAGMSRSSFAARFSATVDEPAMQYLTRWRMLLAADRLARGRLSITAVAQSVGYESDSAFGATFRRFLGRSPRQFVRETQVSR